MGRYDEQGDNDAQRHHGKEDNDVSGAEAAEAIIEFLGKAAPGTLVGILANDSVSPSCTSEKGHYYCDHYAPYWYTVIISAKIWEQYKDKVAEKDQEWKEKHGCHHKAAVA